MISRQATQRLNRLAKQFPVVLITGPRQAGKTTLSKMSFPNHSYVSFENLDTAVRADDDPRGFLHQYSKGAIFDEVQRVPKLLSYLQQMVDEDLRPGRFILTGSQQFGLMGATVQSLVGRVGLVELLPFSYGELSTHSQDFHPSLDQALWQGWYPPIHDRSLDPSLWYEAYISTYLERDVRQIEHIRDMVSFRRFLKLAAGRTGQLVNFSSFAGDCGVSHNTIKSWISVLEASYLVTLIQPYYKNFNKRIVKTPKLYFLDTGLAARLLGILNPDQLATHPLRGALFESYVLSELMKKKHAGLDTADLYFWRDHKGNEVDFILDRADHSEAVEIKSGATFHPDHCKGLMDFISLTGDNFDDGKIIYGGSESFTFKNVAITPWNTFA